MAKKSRGRAEERWLGGSHQDIVGMVHALGNLGVDVLLAVLRADLLLHMAKRGQVALSAAT